jgi:flagellar biosynthetic protein FliP
MLVLTFILLPLGSPLALADEDEAPPSPLGVNAALTDFTTEPEGDAPPSQSASSPLGRARLVSSLQTVVLFGLISMVPVAALMVSAFVRISIVLTLLRQALGSPQVPGNQVLLALSLLLTAVVMTPVGHKVYESAIQPYADGRLDASTAWKTGTDPIKAFMCDQILKTRHERYLWTLYARAVPDSASRPEPTDCMEFPLHVVAPAFLLSELTTALFMGFVIYLPFLVTDLVVSAVLSAMGLFMLPPTLVALPVKLVLFVLADGWLLVADMLLRSFA